MDRICSEADVLIYVGEKSTGVSERFYKNVTVFFFFYNLRKIMLYNNVNI